LNEEAAHRIGRGSRDLNPARLKMAMIPKGATLIDNPLSHAPGFRIENVFVMAGIPSIARAMFAAIENDLDGGTPIQSKSIDIFAREGDFAQALEEIAARHKDVEIGSYPFSREGRFGASIVVRGTDGARVEAVLSEISASLASKN